MHLITGANGQIGSALSKALIQKYGSDNVLLSDIRPIQMDAKFVILDVLDKNAMQQVVEINKVTHIYHLAAILSAKGEANPIWAWDINMKGYLNILDVAHNYKVEKVFYPSSIAAFGSDIDLSVARQNDVRNPETVYGISKVAGEIWGKYYFDKYGLDVRSVRFPGVIGWESMPGGGTTDYAVEIYHEALKHNYYECFLDENEALPMIYMEDTIRSIIELMNAPKEKITIRTSYNLQGISFAPKDIVAAIKHKLPNFKVKYVPDFRQEIAAAWPNVLDDRQAKQDWGWNPKFDLEKITNDMFLHLKPIYEKEQC